MTTKIPLDDGEAAFLAPSAGPCDVHDWPTDGMAPRLIAAMRERHGKGGVNVCARCITRAQAGAALSIVLWTLKATKFRAFNREKELQASIAEVITRTDLPVEREKALGPGDRIDILVAGVGIEVKVAGSVETVQRQLLRYARSEMVEALVLVTSRWQGSGVPDMLEGKPVRVHVIARGLGG